MRFLPEIGGRLGKPMSINQEDPPRGEVRNSNCTYFLILSPIFTNIIIEEAVDPSDRHFLQVYIALLMSRKSYNWGSHCVADARGI